MDFLDILLILGAGFAAGFINAIAGGGSMITFPLLVMLGLDASVANGTNRIAILFQTLFSVLGYKSKGVSEFKYSVWLGVVATIGAIVGAQLVLYVDGELFSKIFAVMMFVIVGIMIFQRKGANTLLGERVGQKATVTSLIIFFFIGIYGGFIQSGVGIIILLALNTIHRFTLVKSNSIKNVVVFLYTIAAVAIFIYNDLIDWEYALYLAVGNSIGGWISSRWSVKKGDKMVRVFMMLAVTALAINLLFFK